MKILLSIVTIIGLALGANFSTDLARWLSSVEMGRAVLSSLGIDQDLSDTEKYLTAEVAIGRIRRTISATGSLQAVSTVEVSSQLSGQIVRLHADFNDTVAQGEALAELDQRGFRARVRQAEASLQMAQETLEIQVAQLDGARGVELEAVTQRKIYSALIEKSRVAHGVAARHLSRTATLVSRGTAAQLMLEDAQSVHDSAAADVMEAEAIAEAHEHVVAYSRAGRQEAEAKLANARAALPLQEATLALANLDLDRSTIRSPIDGVIVGRNVEPGQTVAVDLEAPTLFMIAGDLSEMEIHANIDESDIGEIETGQEATFRVDAFPGVTFDARVSEIRKAAKFVQGVVTYAVILQTSNAAGRLLPGMTSTVRIIVEDIGPVPTLPLAALRFTPDRRTAVTSNNSLPDDGSRIVWVLDRYGTPRPRNIRLGTDDGRDVAVLRGSFSQDERVVTGRVPPPVGGGSVRNHLLMLDAPQILIEARDVSKRYGSGRGAVTALREANLSIAAGEFVAIMGPSGSGKNSLMNLIGLLDRPTTGALHILGKDTANFTSDAQARARNHHIGFVFQSYSLIARRTALANVELPLAYRGVRRKERIRRAETALDTVGLSLHATSYPSEMSGGEQQRVAIARALVTSPNLIVADEPTGALDSKSSDQILSLFESVRAEGRTIVMVTHNPVAAVHASRLINIRDGRIISDGCPSSKQMGLLSVFHKGGSGSSLFDVKPLGFDGSSGGFGWSVF